MFLSIDITRHFQIIFDFIYDIYNFLNNIKFSAFGFNFSFLGIFVSFIVLVLLISFLRFGIEVGVSSRISYSRAENKKDSYLPKHREGRSDYVPLHGNLRSSHYK